MSMINDALRRASSAAKSAPVASPTADSPNTPPPMPTAQCAPPPLPPPPRSDAASSPPSPPPLAGLDGSLPAPPRVPIQPARKKSVLPIVMVALFVFCVAGAAGAFFWQKSHRLMVSAVEKADNEPTDREFAAALPGDEKAAVKITGIVPGTNAPAPVSTAPSLSKQAPSAVTTALAPGPTAPGVSVKFPPLRLQSIFYRPSNPSVIINGKTLFVTDEINGVTVAEIQPFSVTLVLSGQTNVLTLR